MMKKAILVLLLVISGKLSFGQIDTTKINQIVQDHITNNNFEGVILLADQGQIVYQKSVGFKNRKVRSYINDSAKFGIASITKMLTAIIILQLIDEGNLNTQDNINDLLPEFNIYNGENITIHHLLLHISGLPNEKEIIYSSSKSPEQFVRNVISKKGKLSKFEKFNYANIDYVLLGLVIEKKLKSKWENVIKNRIINPLNLKSTGFLSKGNYPDNYAFSYTMSKKGSFVQDPDFHIENFYSAGSMYSNAHDLLIIDQAMYENVLLSENSKKLMFNSYPEYNYTGYSVWTYNYPYAETKPRIMERRGGILGSNSVLVRMLDINKTIIILSTNNRFNPDSFGDMENLREALIIELGKR